MKEKSVLQVNGNLFKYVNNSRSNDINILEFGYEDFKKSNAILVPRTQYDYLLHFIIDGEGHVFKDDTSFKIKKNQLFLLCPGEKMNYRPDDNNPWRYFWIKFNGKMAKHFLLITNLLNNNQIYTTSHAKEITKIFTTLIDLKIHYHTIDLFALSAFYNVMGYILDEQEIVSVCDDQLKYFIDKSIDEIKNNYSSTTININSLCEKLNISHSYLCKIFKQATGKSFKRYLIDYRLSKASELLTFTNNSIKQIAFDVGYQDQLYFSNEFKNRYNISPKLYRQINHKL